MRTFNEIEPPPALFVLVGNFSSIPFPQVGLHRDCVHSLFGFAMCRRYFHSGQMNTRCCVICFKDWQISSGAVRGLLIEADSVCWASVLLLIALPFVVLVPGMGDPGSGAVLPRSHLPRPFVQPLIDIPGIRLTLATNPCRFAMPAFWRVLLAAESSNVFLCISGGFCRLSFCTQMICVFRENLLNKLRRSSLGIGGTAFFSAAPPPHSSPSSLLPLAADRPPVSTGSDTSASMMAFEDTKQNLQAARALAVTVGHELSCTFFRSDGVACWAMQMVKTIFDQAHMCPLPPSVRPIAWTQDQALSLYPLPHMVRRVLSYLTIPRARWCWPISARPLTLPTMIVAA